MNLGGGVATPNLITVRIVTKILVVYQKSHGLAPIPKTIPGHFSVTQILGFPGTLDSLLDL